MTTIGMLYFRRHPKNCRKAYPFAAVARMEGVELFYFSYHDVDFENEQIQGWIYENGTWVKSMKDFPDVVINCCTPRTSKQKKIGRKLKKKAIFTSKPVGHKLRVYKKILEGKKFAEHLIPSFPLLTTNFLDLFNNYETVVIKPDKGHHGADVYIIEKKEKYHVLLGEDERVINEDELIELVNNLLLQQKWLLQPFIKCVTKSGLCYDFRLHMQKNGLGCWEITLIYPRVAGGKKRISNISSGGYRGELIPFLIQEYPGEWKTLKKKLERFALEFTVHFESLYNHQFDELGIDVGLDENGKLWLFEVNWLPGSKHREWEVARRLIPYCQYLVREKREGENIVGSG